ncbi:MAG: hypothetical protein P4N60_08455 [Verrucomicrobiae bacterium]|nr:hypothetical protein [Verrucomicrobiae bacterium]
MNNSPSSVAISGQKHSGLNGEQLASRAFIGWVFILLALDLLTLRWFPVPWNDEALFADPAASLLLHGHWTSTVWYGRGDFAYWGGNMPAYSFLLVPWMWLWGVSAPAMRSLNCVLIALTLVCTWFSVKRLNLIPSPKIRLAILFALSLGYPVSYCVRCGRPDVLGMLLFSVGAFFWTSPKRSAACVGLFVCMVLLPFTGLQYAFYLPALLGLLLWAGGKPVYSRLGAIIAGGCLGAILILAYYQFFAGWDGLLANMSDIRSRLPSGFWSRFQALMTRQIFVYYFGRPHFLLLIAAAALLGAAWKHLTRASRQLLWYGLIMLLVPGIVIGLFCHFGAPYHWLTAAPAMILFAAAAARSWENLGGKTRLAGCLLVLGLAVSGRIMFVLMGWGADVAGYTDRVAQAATAIVQPGEDVFIDPQVYFALKPRAGRIYTPEIVARLTPQEKAAVSVAFLTPDEEYGYAWFTNSFAGHWIQLADFPAPPCQAKTSAGVSRLLKWFHAGYFIGHPLAVYRRYPVMPEAAAR